MRNKMGYQMQTRAAIIYYGSQFWEQVLAVVPITMCLVAVMAIYFQETVNAPAELAGGLIAAMIGLVLFVDGLRVAIMPLGSMLGQQLPEQFKVRYILVVACAMGILCTYAEPAIAGLRPLANLVQRCQTPYLFFVLNDMSEILVLSIGMGVGVAAMIGVLRFLRGWSLKPLIACSLTPTIALACYMKWGNDELSPLIGLAWDCGAVTTGPVTVPILLSLGIGVIKGQKARQAARELVNTKASDGHGQALEGFGIITLASTFPILAVEVLSISLSMVYSAEDIRTNFGSIDCSTYVQETSSSASSDLDLILEAFIFAVRSILPLAFFLILMIKVALRQNLPQTSFEVPVPLGLLEDLQLDAPDSMPVCNVEMGEAQDVGYTESSGDGGGRSYVLKKMEERAMVKLNKGEERKKKRERLEKALAAVGGADDFAALMNDMGIADLTPERIARRQETIDQGPDSPRLDLSSRGREGGLETSCYITAKKQAPLLAGVLESMLGMTLFNIGLIYGFTSLGDQSGMLLPSAFIETKEAPGSPVFEYSAGVAIVLSTVFSLGFLATRAEPALRVMGKTVETLSGGQFTQTALVYIVCVGVGFGLVAGSSKILFDVNIIYLILGKYAFATFMTVFSTENFTNIAWDSAGVTTGPVTVPFVLSIGIGFSKAKNAREGFGILTCASVAPIITVLFTDLIRRMIQSAIQHNQERKLRRLVSTESQTEAPEDLELLLSDVNMRFGATKSPLHQAYSAADAGTQCDLSKTDDNSQSSGVERTETRSVLPVEACNSSHSDAVAQSIQSAVLGSLDIHHNHTANGGFTPRGLQNNMPLSPRAGQSLTTTITVTTNYPALEDVEIFTSRSAA